MRIRSLFVSCLALAAPMAMAETVDVTSTTLLNAGQQTRGGGAGAEPDLVTVAPAFEILTIVARDVQNPVAEDLRIVLGTWGSLEIADRRFDAGTASRLNADLTSAYVSGRFMRRALTLRVGREAVAAGVARMVQIDGAEAALVLPVGLRVSAYAGSPVSQRFVRRSAVFNWNPMGGNLAYGGRVGWALAPPWIGGRPLDVGASANVVKDGGDTVRQEVGADFRVQPRDALAVAGFGAFSAYESRLSEATLRLTWVPTRKVQVDADWRFVAPDLLLSRTSILSVFSAEKRNLFGAGATWQLRHGLLVGASYHAQLEPGEEVDSTHLGHEAEARLEWERGVMLAGVEASFVDSVDNGFVAGRVFCRREMGRWFATADALVHAFREKVSGESMAVTGALGAGMKLAKGFSAVVNGRAGMTPFLEQTYDVMAKLVYNQTYRIREVR